MLSKCSCGRYTNYGSTCVSCAMAKKSGQEYEEIDIDDLFMTDEEEEERDNKKDEK